jgi:hypothetical protein
VFRRAAASIIFVIGCGGSHSDAEEEVVLRVSAVAGLSELRPGLEVSGSSAAALELVFDEPDRHIESMHAEGSNVILIRRASTRYSSQQLAAALRTQDLVSASALDTNRIEVRFRDQKTSTLVAQYAALGFDLGPFQLEFQRPNHVRLVRRGDGEIDAIELLASRRADEWRMLLGHELDVIPWAAALYREQFEGMESVRILDIPATDTATLYFNVRSPLLAEASVRRRISSLLNREAIAQLACGGSQCASKAPRSSDASALPARLSLLIAEDDSTLLTAAKTLRHQMWRFGTEVEIKPVPISELMQRAMSGEFEVALAPLSVADHSFGFFLSPGHPRALPITGFASPEYDAAVDRGDLKAAQALLDREVPATRLFEIRTFAAIDSQFCGKVEPKAGSWRWLSELYPCEAGEP